MQLSVSKYQAISLGRGANLDSIDFALNDRVWLENEFAEIAKAPREQAGVMIDRIVNWTNPGAGWILRRPGRSRAQPHLVRGESYDRDPDFLRFAVHRVWRYRASQRRAHVLVHTAETLGETPLRMHYTGLDNKAQYARARRLWRGFSEGSDSFNSKRQVRDSSVARQAIAAGAAGVRYSS